MQHAMPKIEPLPMVSPTMDNMRNSITEKPPDIFETTGVKPRKPCNCTKSQCLKLYCECFANGEFCNNCNCNNCNNNLEHEDVRQRSIKQCLERNPNAFRPKVIRNSHFILNPPPFFAITFSRLEILKKCRRKKLVK